MHDGNCINSRIQDHSNLLNCFGTLDQQSTGLVSSVTDVKNRTLAKTDIWI